jgi:hypothetical protein
MRQLQITCDGCDLVEDLKLSLSARASHDLKSKGWAMYRAEMFETDTQAPEIFADLCPKCVIKMRQMNRSANWQWTLALPSRATADEERDEFVQASRDAARKTSDRPTVQALASTLGLLSGLEALDAVIRKA